MKLLNILFALILCISASAQEDFIIEVNGKTFEIEPEREYTLSLDGKPLHFKMFLKDTLTFKNGSYSFKYPKDYKVSRLDLEEGIEQVMIMTAEGSGLLIQKYSTINPSMLNEMMLSEVTKESINYGFQMEREAYSRELNSGQTLNISRATLTYKDETNIYEIASIGKKDEGILIMTMIMDNTMSTQGQKLIDMMWNSLTYN